MERLKIPGWKALMVIHLGTAALCVLFLVAAGLNWFGMWDAALVGLNLGMAWGAHQMGLAQRVIDRVIEQRDQLVEINHDLISGKVEVEIEKLELMVERDAHGVPRLH